MPTLHNHLARIANKMPEHTAILSGRHKIEYGRFIEVVRRLANGLKGLGINKGDRVAIVLPNVPHFCISYYAILELGGVVVPINFMSHAQEIARILNDSGAVAMISWDGFRPQVSAALSQVPSCREWLVLGESIPKNSKSLTQIIAHSSAYVEDAGVASEAMATIIYGSYLLDSPLGATFSHTAIISNTSTCHEMFRITADERMLAVLPLFHPLGQTLVMNAAFFVGASLILQPRFAPKETVALIREHNVTFLAGVPAMFKALANQIDENNPAPSLKYCLSYGGPLPAETLQEFESKTDALILQAYGFSEAGPLVTSNRINRDRKAGSVGLPLVGVEIKIINEEGQIARPNTSGEICIKSPSLTQGYFNKPEETQRQLRDGWFVSGDIGYLDDDHYLFLQERKEDIIIKGGFHIFPSEVERVLLNHPAVAEAAVVAMPDPVQGQEVKAYVVLQAGQTSSKEELSDFCRQELPVYKSPKMIEITAALPKSATGRVLKEVLRAGAPAATEKLIS